MADGFFQWFILALVIGILGDDPFGSSLDDAIAGKSVKRPSLKREKAWKLRQGGVRPEEMPQFSSSLTRKRKHLLEILAAVKGAGILTAVRNR